MPKLIAVNSSTCPCSSVGQSVCFVSKGSAVRIRAGAPNYMTKKKPKTETKRATWGEMLTREELLALLDRLDQKKLARKQMSEEAKKSKNPFINLANAAKAVAANPKVPGTKTAQVQRAKHGPQVSTNKPAKKSAGRGR